MLYHAKALMSCEYLASKRKDLLISGLNDVGWHRQTISGELTFVEC
jgi:hypothetical protein